MFDKLRAHLVEDAHKAHKFLTVQLGVVLVFLQMGYDYLPAIKEYLPDHWQAYVAGAIILARIYHQKNLK